MEEKLTTTEQALLALIRKALFDLSTEVVPDVDWEAVCHEARDQAIFGLIAANIPENKQPEDCQSLFYHIFANSLRNLHAQSELVRLFDANHIPLAILKGSAAAMYYPVPLNRSFGDIDFIVPQECFDSAAALLLDHGYVIPHPDDAKSTRHMEYRKDGITFELHHHFSYSDLDLEHFIIDGLHSLASCSIEGFSFPVLPRLANGLVLLAHMRSHLKSGVGLRQVLDWMMYVDKELTDDFWQESFMEAAKSIKLDTLAIVTTRMCQLYLGLSNQITWCKSADEDLCRRLIKYLLSAGNFGRKLGVGKSVQTVTSTFRRLGLFRYLQIAGQQNWKAYKKHKWLKPFCWIYQIGRYSVQLLHAHQGKQFFHDVNSGNDRYDLLDKLNLV